MELAMEVKERPILFSGPMVRAILEGRKSQTRRIMKPQPEHFKDAPHWRWKRKGCKVGPFAVASGDRPGIFGQYCVGDHIWVRETWGRTDDNLGAPVIVFRADNSAFYEGVNELCGRADGGDTPEEWKPSIFMPRWASRISLEVTDVRVERLWDITESDAIAEGAPCIDNDDYDEADPGDDLPQSYRAGFADLWRTINGSESWAANPWVWAITFKRV